MVHGNISTTEGERLEIISPGTRNNNSGPDFFNALVTIGNTTWAGNIEIHINSSDWFKHGHNSDNAYNSIILHVVYKNDIIIKRRDGSNIPTLELAENFNIDILNNYNKLISRNDFPCGKLMGSVKQLVIDSWLDTLAIERLEEKCNEIITRINNSKGNIFQVFYQRIARSLGYTANADAMEMLAIKTPLVMLRKHSNNLFQIESILYGQAGFLNSQFIDSYPNSMKREYRFFQDKYSLSGMDRSIWRFMRLRPASFPTIRISQLALLIHRTSALPNSLLEADNILHLKKSLGVYASRYWNDHYRFDSKVPGNCKKLGETTINSIILNTIIPQLFIIGKLHNNHDEVNKALSWLSEIKYEDNKITRNFIKHGIIPKNACNSQALLQLRQNYCNKKRCLACRIGHSILRSSL